MQAEFKPIIVPDEIVNKKIVVYAVTRNIYKCIVPGLNSILTNGGIDWIYILAEDDDIGLDLPRNVTTVDVSGQKFFSPDGPNYVSQWSYMSLLQSALYQIFPNLNRVVNLDYDTIVLHDLSELWKMPLDNYYYIGVSERRLSFMNDPYLNIGVMMHNLAKLRDGKGDAILDSLNRQSYRYVNQDCVNKLCRGKMLAIENKWNSSYVTGFSSNPYIRHFAGEMNAWYYSGNPLVEEYKKDTYPVTVR